jgi:hypothetical protein
MVERSETHRSGLQDNGEGEEFREWALVVMGIAALNPSYVLILFS